MRKNWPFLVVGIAATLGILWAILAPGSRGLAIAIASILVAAATASYVVLTYRLATATETTAEAAKVAAESARQSFETVRDNSRFDRTIDLMVRWTDPAASDARRKAVELLERGDVEEMGSDETRSLVDFVAPLMTMAMLIEEKTVEEALLRKAFREVVQTYYPKLLPWIEKRRRDAERPSMYEELDHLYERWK